MPTALDEFWSHVPRPPDWRLDWTALDAGYPWVKAMHGCPQDPVYHAEGDVWVHTRMVCEALVDDPAWRALDELARRILFSATLLHDVAPQDEDIRPPIAVVIGLYKVQSTELRRQFRFRGVVAEATVSVVPKKHVEFAMLSVVLALLGVEVVDVRLEARVRDRLLGRMHGTDNVGFEMGQQKRECNVDEGFFRGAINQSDRV